MATEPLPDAPFRPIAELIRAHAHAQPHHAAIVLGDERLDYAALDALMDRIAASLQRDGVAAGRGDRDLRRHLGRAMRRVFLGALRAGVAVAPLAPVRHAGELRLDARATPARAGCSSTQRHGRALGSAAPRGCRAVALDGQAPAAPSTTGSRPRGSAPQPVEIAPGVAVQHHLFVGHHRHAEGHRAAARHALGACRSAARRTATGRETVTLLADAALLEHDAGRLLPDASPSAAPSC